MARHPDFFRQFEAAAAALGITPAAFAAQLEEGARQPGRTGDEVHEWLEAKGVKASRSAVYRWLQDFRLEDRTRRASDVARQYLDVAKQADPTAVSQASVQKFQELVFDFLVNSDGSDSGELMKIAIAMKTGLSAQAQINDLRTRFDAEAKKLVETRRQITQQDIEQVRKAVFG